MRFPYGVYAEYERTVDRGRCSIRACAYPGLGFKIYDGWRATIERRILCGWHFLTGASPFSMEYEDADAFLAIPAPKSRSVILPQTQYVKTRVWKDRTPETITAKWDALFRLPPTSRAAIEDTQAGTAIANHNSTGAFILWKGYGKRKVRKVQRNRPQGWHGNHPEQKPMKVARDTLDDIPIWTPPREEPEVRPKELEPDVAMVDEAEREELIATLDNAEFEELWTNR